MEKLERSIGIDPVEIFRLSSAGGLEVHSHGNPEVSLVTNGQWGNPVGVPFNAEGLRRLAAYLVRLAARLDAEHPLHSRAYAMERSLRRKL